MKNSLRYLISAFCLMIIGCAYNAKEVNNNTLISSYSNGSGYEWKAYKSKNNTDNSFYVNINVRDTNGDLLTEGTNILTLCEKLILNEGNISLRLKKTSVKRQFKAISVGYFSVETRPYLFQANDSIVINFVLSEDDRPILNCE